MEAVAGENFYEAVSRLRMEADFDLDRFGRITRIYDAGCSSEGKFRHHAGWRED